MSEFEGKLPLSWTTTSLGEVCSQPQYGYTTRGSDTGTLRLLRTTDITSGDIDWGSVPFCLENPDDEEKYLLKDGDIVISRAGSVGVSYLLKKPERSVYASYLIRFKPCVDSQYFKYFLDSPYYWKAIADNKLGIAIPNVNASKLSAITIPIPPEHEQHRIVAKIEELFSELDKGIESLKTAQAQLNVYRQALLKHAFEGKLTAQWRADNLDKLESADTLQERIFRERAQSYQQQFSDWEAGGKQGSKPKAPKPLAPLMDEELAELPGLPDGWAWVKLGELTWSVKDGPHFSPKYVDKGVPFISGGNVRPNGVDFSTAKFISTELHKELCKRCKPQQGDILYTKGGTTGIARVNTYDVDFNVWVHVAVLKLTAAVEPFFLQHALNSSFCYAQAQGFTHGVGNQDLGLTRMVNIVLAICSLHEQGKVVEVIEAKMSVIDQLDQTIATSLQQSEVLRQSILKKAFSGQLVPQDLHDEPATALLARIRAERSNSGEKLALAGRRSRKVSTN